MKVFKGIVTSDKMQNTASVRVDRNWMHPIYQKAIKRSKKYLADNQIGAKIGDTVVFKETKPQSKRKRFAIIEIVK